MLSADDRFEEADTRWTQGPLQRSGTREVGYHRYIIYLACVCHVVAAASLERGRSGISESGL
jgi:hypothetical protein